MDYAREGGGGVQVRDLSGRTEDMGVGREHRHFRDFFPDGVQW